MFEQSEIGWHPTYLFFLAMLAIAPALVYFSGQIDISESKFAKRLQVFSNSSLMVIMKFVFGAVWILLVANAALVFFRVAIGRNFLILLWLPLEAQFHLMPIGLVTEILSVQA